MKALVIFCSGNHPLSFLFKKGFQHCFVCIEQNGLWLQVDFTNGIPIVKYLTESDFDLKSFYQEKGMTVVETQVKNSTVTCPFVLRNCVGMTKQFLHIGNFSLTPYQLYKRLR